MAPLKKSKKKHRANNSAPPPIDPKASPDTDWWYSFLNKNSALGHKIPPDEDEAFKYFFRVSKRTFDYICSLVREDLVSRPPSGLINIEGRILSVEKQVAIAMRRLASGESQVSVGGAFGVGQSTVAQVTWRFIESMEERARDHLKWPEPERMDRIKTELEAAFRLPNCSGAIGATHVIMTLPAVESSDDWCDEESNYSMFLQGIVDHEMRFLDIVTGWPGCMTVSRLLKISSFFKLCDTGKRLNGPVTISAESAEIREFIVLLRTHHESEHIKTIVELNCVLPLNHFNYDKLPLWISSLIMISRFFSLGVYIHSRQLSLFHNNCHFWLVMLHCHLVKDN